MTPSDEEKHLVTVRLVGLPLRVHARAQQHSDALRREFQLIMQQGEQNQGGVPRRLLALSVTLGRRYSGFTDEQEARIEAGIAAGEAKLAELTFRVPVHAASAARELAAILDEADRFCREGELLTLETAPDLVTYRNWYLDNFVGQIAGEAPVPWQGTLH